MKGLVHRDRGRPEVVRQPHALVHRRIRNGLAEFFLRIPAFDGFESGWKFLNCGSRHASTGLGTEVIVKLNCLDDVVRFDSMPRRGFGEFCRGGGFVLVKTALPIGGQHELFMKRNRNYKHRFARFCYDLSTSITSDGFCLTVRSKKLFWHMENRFTRCSLP